MEEEVRSAAKELFRTDQAVNAWLRLPSERLGGTPLDLLEAGRGEQVLSELRSVAEQVGPDSGIPRWLSGMFGLGKKRNRQPR